MRTGSQSDSVVARAADLARRRPGGVAVIDGDARLTWQQLDADSIAIARRIIGSSDARRVSVCVFASSKLSAIKAIVGAMRSGHACVPLDAGNPPNRLQFIVADSEPAALLTDSAHLERAKALAPAGCTVIDIDADGQADAHLTLPRIEPQSLAYISYTSGSTGVPKGVTQTHSNALYYADDYIRNVGITDSDRVSLLSPLGVPSGLGDILRGIAAGATLCAYDLQSSGILGLADWLDLRRITMLHTIPTVFREMASRMDASRMLQHLRIVHLGGEALFAGDVAMVRAHTREDCLLMNQFATTETSAITRNFLRNDASVGAEGTVPAGLPIGGLVVEIHAEDGSMAATGEIGELFVCGPQISPGYWRRPDLDAAAFSPDPLRPGWRRYRSGDRGHIDATGKLRFAGRSGTRVKVHGHSVDTMEVEAALASCPGVLRSALIAEGAAAQTDSVRLVACVEAGEGGVCDPVAVRRHLAQRLPLYMRPAAIVYVEAMPLTVGGKIDRQRLATTPTLSVATSPSQIAPRDDIEQRVAQAFGELLALDSVGADDDFFLLGGDSLMAAELQIRLARAFALRVGNFHEDATVAGIAARIREQRAQPSTRARDIPIIVPLWPTGNEIPLFVVHGRHGQAYVSQHFMRLLGDDQPVFSFQARGLDGLREPHASIEAMADEYLEEMRKLRPRGPYFLGSLCAGVFIVTVIARRLREAGECVLPLLLLDPPNSVFQPGYFSQTQKQFEDKIRARKAAGGSGGPVDDPAYMKALIRTVFAFERAIATHRPLPYDGDAFMLSSSARMRGADAGHFARMFPGKIVRHEIGSTHSNAMNPGNPAFERALLKSVAQIRDAASVASHARQSATGARPAVESTADEPRS